MYNYEEQKRHIFTDEGQRMFLKTRDHVHKILKLSGAIRMNEAMSAPGVTGVSWLKLACVDRLVELGEIIEVGQNQSVAGQYRIFVAAY